MTLTREDVLAAIRRVFPGREAADLLSILDGYGGHDAEPQRERVQIAILRLSEGQQAKLDYYVHAAKRDHRDVLFWSESRQGSPPSSATIGAYGAPGMPSTGSAGFATMR